MFNVLYKVELYRRFIDRGGASSKLVQFYGLRAARNYPVGEKPSKWEVEDAPRLHTVEVGPDLRLK